MIAALAPGRRASLEARAHGAATDFIGLPLRSIDASIRAPLRKILQKSEGLARIVNPSSSSWPSSKIRREFRLSLRLDFLTAVKLDANGGKELKN